MRLAVAALPSIRAWGRWVLAAAAIAACTTLAPSAHAEDPAASKRISSSLGIRDVIDEVLARSVDAKSARLDLGTQLQQAALAQRDFLPQTTLSAQSERSGSTASSSAAVVSTWKLRNGATVSTSIGQSVLKSPGSPGVTRQSIASATQSIGVIQPVLRGAGVDVTTVSERLAALSATDARHDFIQSITDLVFTTISSYFALEQAQLAVVLARESIVRQAKARTVNEALFNAGRIARSNLLQGDVDEAQGKVALAQAEYAETVARRKLLRLIASDAHDPDRTLVVLRDSFVDQADDTQVSESQMVSVSLERRSDVRSARSAVAAARLAVVSARDATRNQLDLYSKLDRQRATTEFESAKSTRRLAFGAQWSMSLDKATQQAAVDATNAALTKAELTLAETERNAVAETRDALKAIDFARAQSLLSVRTATLAAQRLDAEVEKARAGRSSVIELTQAQESLRDARTQELQARFAVFTSRLELQRLSGTLLEKWGLGDRAALMLPPGSEVLR